MFWGRYVTVYILNCLGFFCCLGESKKMSFVLRSTVKFSTEIVLNLLRLFDYTYKKSYRVFV